MKSSLKPFLTLFLVTYVTAKDVTFPEGFPFGVATSAYQVEGAWNVDGKGPSIWDTYTHRVPNPIEDNTTGDVAVDTYHRYKEDIALAAATGSKLYRFSISWSRILPTGYADQINEKGIEYYVNVTDEILKYNMTPVVTLYHWDFPQKLYDDGIDWTNESLVPHFVNYARIVIERIPKIGQFGHWSTVNEPKLICRVGYGTTFSPPGLGSDGLLEYNCSYVILKAHAAVYHMYKKEFPHFTAPMYLICDFMWVEPLTNSTEDIEAAERQIQFENGLYFHPIYVGDWPDVVKERINYRSAIEGLEGSRLPHLSDEDIDFIKGTSDMLGVNHYTTLLTANVEEDTTKTIAYDHDVRIVNSVDPNWEFEVNGWGIVPMGFKKVLLWLSENYGKPPIIVAETGYADNGEIHDPKRGEFLNSYFCAARAAMEEGVDLRGLINWSLMDLFGWHSGYITQMGLYHVNHTDANLTRIAKTSVSFWKNLTSTLQLTCDDSLFS